MARAASASIYVLHDLAQIALDPVRAGHRVVVSGHSHKPLHTVRDGVHYVNPGSAGPRRFRLPIALARLTIERGHVSVELVELDA